MLYEFYEWNHAVLAPFRAVAEATRSLYQNPLNPISHTGMGRTVAAMAEVFERTTRVYGKPEWGLHDCFVDGMRVPVVDRVVWEKPFGRLLHFERELPAGRRKDPRFLLVAPMSGHYATLLRGTVEALLPYGEVYITDWQDARKVPVDAGRFDLDDYVDYLIEILHFLGPDTNVIGVCQPAVPVMMAVARMEEEGDPCSPATMTLMGGPIDTRVNPTAVNRLAEEKGIDWFRDNVVMKVPFPQPGFMRCVYPGFLQLTGFMSMNLDRHLIAHKDFYWHLVKDDGDSAEKHRTFYDEYNAVMDLTAEFYLQTVEEVFIKHSLPKGEITHRGHRLDMGRIRHTALLTIEGENDDISGLCQTKDAHDLCTSIPDDMRVHYMQPKVGHYGVFNGSRFRAEIAPRIVDFALTHGRRASRMPAKADVGPEAATMQPPAALDAAPTMPTAFGAPASTPAERTGRPAADTPGESAKPAARRIKGASAEAGLVSRAGTKPAKAKGAAETKVVAASAEAKTAKAVAAKAEPVSAETKPAASIAARRPAQKAGSAASANADARPAETEVKPAKVEPAESKSEAAPDTAPALVAPQAAAATDAGRDDTPAPAASPDVVATPKAPVSAPRSAAALRPAKATRKSRRRR